MSDVALTHASIRSEEEGHASNNPMVSGFQEDLEGEEPGDVVQVSIPVTSSMRSLSLTSDPLTDTRVQQQSVSGASSVSSFVVGSGSDAGSSRGKKSKKSRLKSDNQSASRAKGRTKKSARDAEKQKLEQFLGPVDRPVDSSEYELF